MGRSWLRLFLVCLTVTLCAAGMQQDLADFAAIRLPAATAVHPDMPTSIRGVGYASPAAEMTFMRPPVANASGAARTELPIKLPNGRQGMQPDLALRYDSETGNTWCGLGWDLSLEAVHIDTRWGVPRYDPDVETETYLLNGMQLAPVAHRTAPRERMAEKQFHQRIEESFHQIIRHGSRPDNYWWEVTTKEGLRKFFGGTPESGLESSAILTDASGNIAQWCLVEERDLHSNFVRYHYTIVEDTGVPGGSVPGYHIYPQYITYTGHQGMPGKYRIDFVRDRQLGESRRPDVHISARLGFKQVMTDRLRHIEIRLEDALIRTYDLKYRTGAFFKSLLQEVTILDEAGVPFYTHTLDYYDEIRDGPEYTPFHAAEAWEVPDDQVEGEIRTANTLFPNETSVLGGSASSDWSIGSAATVGLIGNLAAKTNTAGGNFTYGSASGTGLIALVDIDGDGLADKVFRRPEGLFYRPNTSGNGIKAFGAEKAITGIPDFSRSTTDSYATGAEAHPGVGFVGYTFNDITTTVNTYFSDFNGDGLIDIGFNGTVYFNHINASGAPVFTPNSADTPSPVTVGATVDPDLFEIDPEEQEARIDAAPLHDLVRMWEAPYDGNVRIAGPVRLLDDPGLESQAYQKKDGVRVAIQVRGAELWSTNMDADDFSEKFPNGVASVSVDRGDRIYFRVQSRFDGAYDQVLWDPVITYLTLPDTLTDANQKPFYRYVASEDFLLASCQLTTMPASGTITIDGAFEKPLTSDEIRLSIIKRQSGNDIPVFDTTFAWGSAVAQDIVLEDLEVTKDDEILFLLRSTTQVEWSAIKWSPRITYTSASDGTKVLADDGTPLVRYCPAPDYRMYNDPVRKTPVFICPDSGTLTVTGNVDGGFLANGNIWLSIKGNTSLLAKVALTVNNGNIDPVGPSILSVNAGDTLFFEYHTTDRALALALNAVRVELDLNGSTLTEPAGLHTFRDEEDIIFGPMYRGWGWFAYNGNREKALQPIDESLLEINEDAEDQAGDVGDIEDADDIENVFDASREAFILLISDPKNRYWIGSDNLTYLRSDTVSSSRMGEDDVTPPDFASDGESIPAPFIISESRVHSIAGGASGAGAGAGGSVAFNTTKNVIDVFDLNGDRFPDIVHTDMIQFTNPLGGLVANAQPHSLGQHQAESFAAGLSANVGFVHSSATNAGDASTPNRGSAKRGSMHSGGSDKARKSARNNRSAGAKSRVNKSGKKSGDASRASKSSVGIDGGFTYDRDSTAQTWMDINGDGLPDMLYRDGNVALNLGYRFAAAEKWDFENIREGDSRDYGGGLGINLFGGSIMAGVSVNRTDNQVLRGFVDLNGDGLPDHVVSVDPVRVRLNLGSHFSEPVPWGDITVFEEGSATGESANAAFTVCIPVVILGIKICVNPGSSTGRGVSRIKQQLFDLDGDGFMDNLSSTHDGELIVRRSTIGKTNLLKTIYRPLGATISLDYTMTGNTRDMPYSKWVLESVTVDDGLEGDGADIRKTAFSYSNGKHDRHEREFYGFARVFHHELDTENADAIYRTTTYTYENTNYYSKQLLISERVSDENGLPFTETRHAYTLRDVVTGEILPPSYASNDAGSAFPALEKTTNLYYEGMEDPGLQKIVRYTYDVFGNVIRYTDEGDQTTTDQHVVHITYHDPASTYLKSIPATIRVESEGTTRRFSEQDIDDRGNVLQVRKYLEAGDPAIFDYTYNAFGQVTEELRPENHRGQRMQYRYAYDDLVQIYPVRIEDAYGYVSESTYDLKYGKALETMDIRNQKMMYTLDAQGRVISVTGPYELLSGAPYTMAFAYFPDAETPYAETRHYDPEYQSDILAMTFVDGLGRTVQTKKTGLLFDPDSRTEQEVMLVSGTDMYDPFGRIVESHYPVHEEPGSNSFNSSIDPVTPTTITYDVLDRAVSLQLPDGATTNILFGIDQDNTGTVRRFSRQTDALGNTTASFTDQRSRVRAEMWDGPNGEVWTNYQYNAINELLSVTDHESHTTHFEYDNFGRRVLIHHPDGGRVIFQYDAADNLTKKITDKILAFAPDEGGVLYTYDHERLVQIDYPKHFENKVQFHYGGPNAEYHRAGLVWLREDAAGGEEFFYGPLGEVVKSIRTMLINPAIVETYVSEYTYDTWGRIQEMAYPDGEIVEYTYNKAGFLSAMSGVKQGQQYAYIARTGYDKFGERTYLQYGNGTETYWAFENDRRRMSGMEIVLNNGKRIVQNTYTYDAVSNLITMGNAANTEGNALGGRTDFTFEYDKLYRLAGASGKWNGTGDRQKEYTLRVEYDDLNNILSKDLHYFIDGGTDADGIQMAFAYDGEAPHQPSVISGREQEYDPSGNLVATRGDAILTYSQKRVDEENRISGISNNGYISLYTYDGRGERAIRSHGGQQGVFINGAPAGAIHHRSNYAAYVSPFFVARNGSFMKHYFLGDQRILSKAGTGTFNNRSWPNGGITAGDRNYLQRMQQLALAQDTYFETLGIPPGPPTLPGYYGQPEYQSDPLPPAAGNPYPNPPPNWPGPTGPPDPGGPPGPPVWFGPQPTRDEISAGYGFDSSGTRLFLETDVSFYHCDHSGSVNYLTDFAGEVRQHVEYTPFGDIFVEAVRNGKPLPYKFAGKELEPETGLYYFGARYYNPATAQWQSVDPLSEQFPAWSPYAYAFHNPLKYVDPDGRVPGEFFNSPEKAAKDFARHYNPVSIAQNVEYGASIYAIPLNANTFYTYTFPARGSEDGVTPSPAPTGFTVVADIHTHSAYSPDFDNDHFSSADISGNEAERIAGYVATPRGRLLKYDPDTRQTTIVSKSIPFDQQHPRLKRPGKRKKKAGGLRPHQRSARLHLGSKSRARH